MDRQPYAFVLSAGYPVGLSRVFPRGDGDGLVALARGLATSPLWADMTEAVLVARPAPRPLLGILGYFSPAERSRIEALRSQLPMTRVRYVTYEQAEQDCQRLAEMLVERFPVEDLRAFQFVGLPRGGLIVLGMLSYLLDLPPSALGSEAPLGGPLVVVDDLAISGDRFRRFLSGCTSERVVFATLYAAPELRAAVEAREPSVQACLSARDLQDHARENLGDEYESWRQRWLARSDDFWVGQLDHVCFPWNEPDIGIWNGVTERVERGWRVIPPELCLKNRPAAGSQIQVQRTAPGPIKPSEYALFAELQGQVLLAHIGTGSVVALDGVAADMWRTITEYGDLRRATSSLLEEYEVNSSTLRGDLEDFVNALTVRGLLETT